MTTTLIAVAKDSTAMDVLAQRYRAAFDKVQGGRAQWIEGTLELAAVILEAREKFTSDREYGGWLTRNQLEYLHPNDRLALVGFGERERKKPGAGRKLLEDNFGFAWRTIWEKKAKSSQPYSTSSGKVQQRPNAQYVKRNRVPTVMQDDNPAPVRKAVVLNGLTREQVDPNFKGTPLEFATKHGHVNLQTKQQVEQSKRQEELMAWLGLVSDHERTARALLAAAVDPDTLRQWMSKPAKAEKLRTWLSNIERACESLRKCEPDK
jgi:hypothetical protein